MQFKILSICWSFIITVESSNINTPSFFYSPNSCGQVQAADIGIMGAPARKMDPEKGKAVAVPGCKIFVGGTIGENGHLSLEPYVTGIPLDNEDLIPTLVDILKKEFGAKDAQPQEDMVVIDE